jgi:hypothetical protein
MQTSRFSLFSQGSAVGFGAVAWGYSNSMLAAKTSSK